MEDRERAVGAEAAPGGTLIGAPASQRMASASPRPDAARPQPPATATRASDTVTLVLVGFAVWTVLALLSALQSALYVEQTGGPVVWPRLLAGSLLDWYTCAIFTPVFFWMARRLPLERRHLTGRVPLYLLVTSICVVLKYAFLARVLRSLGGTSVTFEGALRRSFISESIILWAVLGVVHGIEYYRRLRERELQLARVSGELTAARLDALTAQLQPHFLFNALNGVSTLMHRDVEAADAMLASLGDLLRRSLDPSAGHELPLADELLILESYLDVVRARFADRLTIELDIEPAAAEVLVPRLLLQPLVENAIEHGIARRRGAGRVTVRAAVQGGRLLLDVEDDGAGLGGAPFPPEGIGLSNTRRRLRELYGDDHSLALEERAGGGLKVALVLPYRVLQPAR